MILKRLLSNFVSSSSFSSSSAPRLLKIGDVLKRSRIFSDLDILEYSRLSHDLNPLHFDSEFARNLGCEDRVVHGMLVASLFPLTIASHFPGAVYVSQSLLFELPVYIGNKIVSELKVVNLRESKKRFIAKFSTKCYLNGVILVLDGEATAILPTIAMEHME